jgi:hypothetical protein
VVAGASPAASNGALDNRCRRLVLELPSLDGSARFGFDTGRDPEPPVPELPRPVAHGPRCRPPIGRRWSRRQHRPTMQPAKAARPEIYVPATALAASTHGKISCTDCHKDATTLPHAARLKPVDCNAGCHSPQRSDYLQGVHAEAVARGDTKAPTCSTCPRRPRDPAQVRPPLAHPPAQHREDLRRLSPPAHDELRRPRRRGTHPEISRERPRPRDRQGWSRGRRDVRGLSRQPPCVALEGRALDRQPRQRRHHLRQVPHRAFRDVPLQRPRPGACEGEREGAGVFGLSYRPRDHAHRRAGVHARHRRRMRIVSRQAAAGQHAPDLVVRNVSPKLSRPGRVARLNARRAVQRLSRRPRHPPHGRPRLAAERNEPAQYVPAVSQGRRRRSSRCSTRMPTTATAPATRSCTACGCTSSS